MFQYYILPIRGKMNICIIYLLIYKIIADNIQTRNHNIYAFPAVSYRQQIRYCNI